MLNTYRMKSKILEELSRTCPLEIRLRVTTEMAFISLLTELGYREDKMWTEEEDEILTKLCLFSKKVTQWHLKEIEQWEKDGRP